MSFLYAMEKPQLEEKMAEGIGHNFWNTATTYAEVIFVYFFVSLYINLNTANC